ncbi:MULTISPECIES: MFS transporter [Micromonospora]|uniref:MFS transporter n=1 Tax=Micromonospora solifontis TaxID=2487138 RepID=A0ABX9WMP7_9ACTN|nr:MULTISPECIES: MFS transporter [Micromonospora]NES13756.1 MFS transporter [Micromonospora sp. PPF5-17B]NES35547.1 MFS transporter [Micromonospora solifontis]NES55967.1 MFS transporter [Micromonospora sp. PPF5-6]RNM00643.1 MFS transporter [Micromonospora solifontis]
MNELRSWVGSVSRLLSHPELRWFLPGALVSALGDGMSMVAVAWLAVQIAPPDQAGVWTGLAVAAYALPAPIGAAVLARLMRRLPASRLVAADASVRALSLGAVAALAVAGLLGPVGYVALLATSSLLHAWGNAGAYTLVAELLPDEDRITGNALLSTFSQAAFVVGPALAGGLTALTGPGWVIGVDAASFAVLAAVSRKVPARPAAAVAGTSATPATGGWRTILDRPRLLGLIAVTCAFFFLYGPVEVALPVHVAHDLQGSPGLLGLYWSVFGIGATVGALGAALLRHRAPWPVVVSIIVGWGAALLPLGLTDAVAPGLVGLAAGGLIYGPFTAISTALFQRETPPQALSRVLAARTALTTPATGLGTLVGGPVVAAVGARPTLLASALLTIALGGSVAAALRLSALRTRFRGRVRGGHGCAAARPEEML